MWFYELNLKEWYDVVQKVTRTIWQLCSSAAWHLHLTAIAPTASYLSDTDMRQLAFVPQNPHLFQEQIYNPWQAENLILVWLLLVVVAFVKHYRLEVC